MTCLLEAFASRSTSISMHVPHFCTFFKWIWGFWRWMLLALFFLPLQTLLDTLTLPYNLVQPHTINKDVMWHLESFSISDRVDYIQQMLFNYTYYFSQTRFSTVVLSALVTRHHFVVATMNLLWYSRLKWYLLYQKNICKSSFDKLIGGMITLQGRIF